MTKIWIAFIKTVSQTFLFLNFCFLWLVQSITFMGLFLQLNLIIFVDVFRISTLLTLIAMSVMFTTLLIINIFEAYEQR